MLYTKLAIALAVFAAGSFSGWRVNNWRHEAAELERQNRQVAAAKALANRMDRAAEAFQNRETAADQREQAAQKEVIRVVTKVEYRAQCLDDDGMRLLSDAARASNAARGLAPAVPAAPGSE